MSTAATLSSTICDFLRNLLNDISCQVTEEAVRRIATCIVDTVAENGVQIGEWVINSITKVLASIRRGAEVTYSSTKSILKEFYEAIKATTCVIGTLIGTLTEALTFTGWNFIIYCIGRISGNEFVRRTQQHVDNIMNPSAKPIAGATVGAVAGAVIGSVVPVIGTVAGGLAGFIGGSFVSVVVARNT